MFRRNPWQEVISGLGEPPPFLEVLLLSLALGCLADAVDSGRMVVEHFRLGPEVWQHGELWRVVTYGLIGQGGISAWSVVQLVLVYWLVQQMVTWLRAPGARNVLLGGVVFAGATAILAQVVSNLLAAISSGDVGGFAGVVAATAWGWTQSMPR